MVCTTVSAIRRSASLLFKEVMPVEVNEALALMIQFGSLIVALIGLVVSIVVAIVNRDKKK